MTDGIVRDIHTTQSIIGAIALAIGLMYSSTAAHAGSADRAARGAVVTIYKHSGKRVCGRACGYAAGRAGGAIYDGVQERSIRYGRKLQQFGWGVRQRYQQRRRRYRPAPRYRPRPYRRNRPRRYRRRY